MRSNDYRRHRRDGLVLARGHRQRIRECDRILDNPTTATDEPHWQASRTDWTARLRREQLLLGALRTSTRLWQSQVIAQHRAALALTDKVL
jgi:hypothetical protein